MQELVSAVEPEYDFLSTHLPLSTSKRDIAEIDIIAKKGDRIDIYEVKCSHRIHKATKQLKRIKRFFEGEKTRSFFYCGSSKLLTRITL